MPLPPMTAEMSAAALVKAKEARTARAEALAALKGGYVHPADAFAKGDGTSPFDRIPVRRALLALPGVGPKAADAIMAEVGIAAKRRIGGLGPRQREALAARLR
jgi:endonuclease III